MGNDGDQNLSMPNLSLFLWRVAERAEARPGAAGEGF